MPHLFHLLESDITECMFYVRFCSRSTVLPYRDRIRTQFVYAYDQKGKGSSRETGAGYHEA